MIKWKTEIRAGKAGIALFWKQQKHLNQLSCQLWQTAQNNYLLSPYPINFGLLIDNKEPSCLSVELSPVNHLLTDLTLMHKAHSEVWSGSTFSDTAEYLYNNLAAIILAKTGLH